MVIAALAMAAPDGSVMVPANWPFCTCAAVPRTKVSKEKHTRGKCSFFIDVPSPDGEMFFGNVCARQPFRRFDQPRITVANPLRLMLKRCSFAFSTQLTKLVAGSPKIALKDA
jgi:hypothetical protein